MEKKLLVLGGTPQQLKIIERAREKGIKTIVTDNVPESFAKKHADITYDISITDVDRLVELCKKECVDGVISGYIDPCQRPYNALCERLGLNCYGTKEQFYLLTDKHAFKQLCVSRGVGVIPEYSEENLYGIEYPVFVKPVDSRGSRGQSVCYNRIELESAIKVAKMESSNGDIIIEKYMRDAHEFQVTYFFVEGEAYLLRTCDSYVGKVCHQLDKVVACAVSPSVYTEKYVETAHDRVVNMLKGIGYKNGPVFMQGFEDQGKFRFFDPGLRFPGVDYERVYKKVFGIDLMDAMISIAFTGKSGDIDLPEEGVWLKGKRSAILFPTIKAGTIGKICGVEHVINMPEVVSFLPRCSVGDTIGWSYNVNQRAAEIDCIASDTEALKNCIREIQRVFKIYDTDGNDMMLETFDTERII